jgi:hypothetical protein
VGRGKSAKVGRPMQRPLIQLSNVYKKFGTNQVLRGVSLIKEVRATAESKDSLYYEFDVGS